LRTRRSILTYASGIVFMAATVLTALFTTPILLRLLHKDRYGAFRMVTDWLGYLTLLDLGLGAALAPLFARALGQSDARTLRAALGAGMHAYAKLTMLVIFVGLSMTPLIMWQVEVLPGQRGDLRVAWMVCVLSFLAMTFAPLRTLSDANQRGYRVNFLMTLQCLLITALSVLFAWAGWGITGQAWAYSLGIGAFFVMLTCTVVRGNRRLLRSAWRSPADPEIQRTIWNLSLPSLLVALSGRVGLLSDNLVAGGFLGPAMAASLFVTVRLAGLAQTQLQAMGVATWAGLAELYARGDHSTFNRRLVELTKVVGFVGLAVLAPIAAYNHHFFNLWVGQKLVDYGGNTVTVAAALNALLLGLFSFWGWCFTGTGQVRALLAPTLTASAINLAASLLLTHQRGLVGPVLGTLIANLTISIWWLPILLSRRFGISLRSLIGAVVSPAAWGFLYAIGLWWLARSHPIETWFGLAAEAGGAAAGFLILGSAVILNAEERALWRVRLANIIPSRNGRPQSHAMEKGQPIREPANLAAGPRSVDSDGHASR
jgi:O-antigen/teichoic acid export membrane protein